MSERTTNLPALLPATRDNLPHVTVAMLLDALAEYEVARAASSRNPKQTFRWVFSAEGNVAAQADMENLGDLSVLFICPANQAEALLEHNASVFVLAVSKDDPCDRLLEKHPGRTLALKTEKPLSELALTVQSFFVSMMLWENGLKSISREGGSLDNILNASVPMLRNFIFVSDANFNVIGRTTLVAPPDALHKRILTTNRLSSKVIAEDRFRLPEKTFYTRDASEVSPFDRVSYPVHFSHSYFGSISMACNERPDTEGLRDAFLLLIKYMLPLCMKLWNKQAELNLPSYFFFEKLLEGNRDLSSEYIRSQMEVAGLSKAQAFKLAQLDIDAGVDPSRASAVMHAASSTNRGCAICFPHQDKLLLLYYSNSPEDKSLSHASTQGELEERVLLPHETTCGYSSLFWDIRDMDLAFLQTKIALHFRKSISKEHLAAEEPVSHRVFLFEDALVYYQIDPSEKNRRLIDHIFENTPVDILYREDQENGTNYLSLIWLYLKSERNATTVAKKLHMHRNTVLYHIERIEKRFDFSFSTRSARDWIYLCFKRFFLAQSQDPLDTFGRNCEEAVKTPPIRYPLTRVHRTRTRRERLKPKRRARQARL